MFVTYKIKNLTQSDYSIVTFRKFYQVIFWEKDFKTLNIYTNTVIGSEKDNKRAPLTSTFDIECSFSCNDEQNNTELPFEATFTDKSNFLSSDINAFQAVWGDKTSVIISNDDFNEKYVSLFTTADNITTNAVNEYLFIKNSTNPGLESNTIAKIVKSTVVKNEKKFRINSSQDIHQNTEIVNLTLTTIKFPEKQSPHLNFFIEFEKSQEFNFLDNSIYFILPDGFDAKGKNASIYLKTTNDPIEQENPFQTLDPDSKKYVQDWINKGIEERKYYRIYKKEIKSFLNTQNYHKLHFNFRIISTVNPVISQLLYGFLVALFFAYGLDQTRLMNYRLLFGFHQYIPPGVNFFLTYGILFISILFKINLGKNFESPISTRWRIFAFGLSILWFISLYIFPNPQSFYGSSNMSCPDNFSNWGIITSYILNGLAFIANLTSLIIMNHYHKDEINLSLLEHLKHLFKINK